MKKIFFAIMLCMPMLSAAQNTWEMPEEPEEHESINRRYLVGAVPVENGKVVFRSTIEVPGKNAQEIYSVVKKYMQKMLKEKNQTEQSRIVIDDSVNHQICGSFQEWLVFKNTALVLDRTRFMYNLLANCSDGKVDMQITRIYYLYDEERDPVTYKAEEWITDEYGLKKKKNKLSRVSGKFRQKTIDRKDFIFNKIEFLLQN